MKKQFKKKGNQATAAVKNQAQQNLPAPQNILHSYNRYIIPALILFVFILYGNSIMHDYVLDDDMFTRNNVFVQKGFSGIGYLFKKGFLYGFNGENDQSYRPIPLTFLATEVQLFGNNPHVHHFFNVFWYAITAVFLFLTLSLMFRKYNFIVPLLITLLFIAHPVHTEVLANIKSRDEILSFLFCILTLYFSLKANNYKLSAISYQLLSWLFFFLAILCKENVLTFVAIIPLVYYFFTDIPIKKIAFISFPFLISAGIYMIIRANVLDSITFSQKIDVINNSLMMANTFSARLATAFFVLGKYIILLLFPLILSYDYSYNQIPIVYVTSVYAILPALLYLALVVYTVMNIKKKNPVAFGILYFIITMTLVSNIFVSIASSMGERFLYTSSLGFCIAIVFVLLRVIKLKPESNHLQFTIKNLQLFGAVTVILLLFTARTIARNAVWENSETLYKSGIITAPNSARAHEYCAFQYSQDASGSSDAKTRDTDFARAIDEYKKAIAILPDFNLAWFDLGNNYLAMGKTDDAINKFEKCVELDSNNFDALNALGNIYLNEKQYDKAIAYYNKSLEVKPYQLSPYLSLDQIYGNSGQLDKARENIDKARKFNPNVTFVGK
jgi:hypothetical protein